MGQFRYLLFAESRRTFADRDRPGDLLPIPPFKPKFRPNASGATSQSTRNDDCTSTAELQQTQSGSNKFSRYKNP
jgi:hypothetical protein